MKSSESINAMPLLVIAFRSSAFFFCGLLFRNWIREASGHSFTHNSPNETEEILFGMIYESSKVIKCILITEMFSVLMFG